MKKTVKNYRVNGINYLSFRAACRAAKLAVCQSNDMAAVQRWEPKQYDGGAWETVFVYHLESGRIKRR